MKLLLHNIRSCHNVGSVFRTADGIGVDHIFLGGYTPLPVDEYGNPVKRFVKVSLGAEKTIPYSRVRNIGVFLDEYKKEGLVIAVEIEDRSINYADLKLTVPELKNCLLVMGNEKRGLSKVILNKADYILKIPMHGHKESLNVAVACAIVGFSLRDHSNKS